MTENNIRDGTLISDELKVVVARPRTKDVELDAIVEHVNEAETPRAEQAGAAGSGKKRKRPKS